MKSAISRKALLTLACVGAGATTALVPAAAHAEAPAAEPRAQMQVSTPEGDFTIQGTCGDSFTPSLGGAIETARAYWSVWCQSGNVYMEGWVDDKRSDGKCAAVRGEFPNSPTQHARNCPADSPRTEFTFKGTGRTVNGYLYLD